jgi:hypothetical protein
MSGRATFPLAVFTCFLVLAITGGPAAAYAPQLRRYPYLTDVVGSSATINWATDPSSPVGTAIFDVVGSDGSCTPSYSVRATKTNIRVKSTREYQWKAVLSLAPDTEYCYRVFLGSRAIDLLGSDPTPRFRTQLPS